MDFENLQYNKFEYIGTSQSDYKFHRTFMDYAHRIKNKFQSLAGLDLTPTRGVIFSWG
jgi:hypothetical protein